MDELQEARRHIRPRRQYWLWSLTVIVVALMAHGVGYIQGAVITYQRRTFDMQSDCEALGAVVLNAQLYRCTRVRTFKPQRPAEVTEL